MNHRAGAIIKLPILSGFFFSVSGRFTLATGPDARLVEGWLCLFVRPQCGEEGRGRAEGLGLFDLSSASRQDTSRRSRAIARVPSTHLFRDRFCCSRRVQLVWL